MKQDIDINEVKRLYYDEKLSAGTVAEQLGTYKEKIYNLMDEHGLKRRSKVEAQQLRRGSDQVVASIDEVLRLYFDEGLSTATIGKKLGVHAESVAYRIRRAGYKLRSRGRSGGKPRTMFSGDEKEEIRKLYCEEELSLARIGFKFNVSAGTIQKTLKSLGAEIRKPHESQKILKEKELQRHKRRALKNAGPKLKPSEVSDNKVLQLRKEDLTIDEIAIKCSLSNLQVYNILERNGVLNVSGITR